MKHNPMMLIQQISSLRQQRLKASEPVSDITSSRVALARDGQLKAPFQKRSYLELRRAGVIVSFSKHIDPDLWNAEDDEMEGMSILDDGEYADEIDRELDAVEHRIRAVGRALVTKSRVEEDEQEGGLGRKNQDMGEHVGPEGRAFRVLVLRKEREAGLFNVTVSAGDSTVESF